MDELIFFLLKKRAHLQPVRITTCELGKILGMSQQNASKKLLDFEKGGTVERTKQGVFVTKKGVEGAYAAYSELKNVFEKEAVEIAGTVISGLGEGKYYMSFPEYKKQIREKLGFQPHEGTLNMKLPPAENDKKANFLKNSEPVIIKGFRKGERTFGDLFAYPCAIGKAKCALIIPLRTHHPSEIVEIISPSNLKKTLGKKDGDEIKIEFG